MLGATERRFGMDTTATAGLVFLAIIGLVLLILVIKTLYTVRTASAGVVERFGKFNRIVQPGLHVLIPFAENVYFVNLQVQQASFSVETKTHDNVFVQIPVSVQYQILPDKIFDAFYKLHRAPAVEPTESGRAPDAAAATGQTAVSGGA